MRFRGAAPRNPSQVRSVHLVDLVQRFVFTAMINRQPLPQGPLTVRAKYRIGTVSAPCAGAAAKSGKSATQFGIGVTRHPVFVFPGRRKNVARHRSNGGTRRRDKSFDGPTWESLALIMGKDGMKESRAGPPNANSVWRVRGGCRWIRSGERGDRKRRQVPDPRAPGYYEKLHPPPRRIGASVSAGMSHFSV
jgi:hypothetical protein